MCSYCCQNWSTVAINRDNFEKNRDGSLSKSNAIDVKSYLLTQVDSSYAPDKPGSGKYIYEKPDFKSKRLGVLRKGTLIASGEISDGKGGYGSFFSVSLPCNKTGYLYKGYWKKDGSFSSAGVGHVIMEY